MEKRCAKNIYKKVLSLLALILASVALSVCVLMGILLPYKIAYADSTQEVLVAPVSNLEGNEYAGASTLCLFRGNNDKFYIPESYYIYLSGAINIGQYYPVVYCGISQEFYYASETAPTCSPVVFADGVSPFPDVRLTLKDESLAFNGLEINSDYTIKFLGYHTENANLIYIAAMLDGSNYFGFASRDSFEEFVVPYHPIAQAERDRLIASKQQPDPDKGDIIPNTSLALRIVLIIGIAVPAIIIAILLFKPSKNDRSQGKSVMRKERGRNEFDYDSTRTYREGDRYDSLNDSHYDSRRSDPRFGSQDDYDQRRDPRYDSRSDRYDPRDDYRR